jgi:hypothetical protein
MSVDQFPCRPSKVQGQRRYLPVPACTVPLAGVLKKMEREVAAAAITQICQQDGDDWRPVTSIEFGAMLRTYEDSNTVLSSMHGNILNQLNALHAEGLVLINRDKNPHTISVTPKLVEMMQ